MNKELIARITITFHFIITMFFVFIPFLIPRSIWPDRPLWHFIFMTVIISSGIATALYYKIKYKIRKDFICFINLITQRIRGYKYNNLKNYEYSNGREIFRVFEINTPKNFPILVLYLVFIISFILFIFS